MNIKRVSYGLLGAAMMTGVFASCYETKYEEKAKAQAVKYLKGDELLKAERHASQQHDYDAYSGEAIMYWDSLLAEAKVKEAYTKGRQLIRDSLNNIHYRKEKYKATLDTILPENVAENSKNEYAKYTTAEEFIKARDNAPDSYRPSAYNNKVTSTHFWNLITIANKQQEAYNKGMADERAKYKTSDNNKESEVQQSLNAYDRIRLEGQNEVIQVVNGAKQAAKQSDKEIQQSLNAYDRIRLEEQNEVIQVVDGAKKTTK